MIPHNLWLFLVTGQLYKNILLCFMHYIEQCCYGIQHWSETLCCRKL